MTPPLFILMILAAAAAVALVIFLAGLLFFPFRTALRLAGASAIGGGIGFAGTAVAMLPFHRDALLSGPAALSYFGPSIISGLIGGLLCAAMLARLLRQAKETRD